jgi:hypothetical protein
MILWGVRRAGGYVERAFDGPSAFRLESALMGRDPVAQVVVSRDGVSWRLVPWESSVRPDPRPPRRPRKISIRERIIKRREWFRASR